MQRLTRDQYFMQIANTTSVRSTCERAHVGAVAVQDNRIIATGYNGAPSMSDHCDKTGHNLVDNHCIATIHAEMNLICQAAKTNVSLNHAIIYTTHQPCFECVKHLKNVGIKEIIFEEMKIDKKLDHTNNFGIPLYIFEAGKRNRLTKNEWLGVKMKTKMPEGMWKQEYKAEFKEVKKK